MASPQTTLPDPDVTIPSAVRAASARADELHRQMFAPQRSAEQPAEQQEGAPNEEQPRQEAREQASDAEQRTEQRTEPPKQEQPKSEPKTDWERQYKGMEGRYKKQIEDLQNANQALMGRIEELARQPTPAPAPAPTKLLTPEEEAEYGPDFLNVVSKRAQEQMAPLLTEIETLKAQLAGVGQHVQATTRDAMLARMDQSVPEWRELNNDQEFLDWLALPDAYSGAIRHDLLKAAYQSNNASRLAAFFHGFLAERAALSSASAQPQSAPAKPAKTPLETFAAPGRARSTAGNPPPVEKPFFTHAQVADFYVDVRRGKYAGKDDERNRLEQQIIEAGRDGRIR